jgi:hypothetical protein
MEKICCKCHDKFKSTSVVKGKRVSLTGRKYCLNCVPYGERTIYAGEVVKYPGRDIDGCVVSRNFLCSKCKKRRFQKTRNNVCSSCRNKDLRINRKKEAVRTMGGKCLICGYSKSLRALDFHHLNSDDKHSDLSRLWTGKLSNVMGELKNVFWSVVDVMRRFTTV